jgi:polyribonucleotide nucleotidyltransferase
MFNVVKKSIDLGDGRSITIETGKLARQADGAVIIRMGKTMMLATVVSAKDAREDVDFMPLSVDYQEKYAAGGRFPGGFLKREARPSDYEVLIARLVDRALRPLFPDDYHAETFVTITLISAEKDTPPDALAGLAASAALAVSDIPFNGPISEVRVVRVDGKFIINPTFAQIEKADMDMMVGATYDNILMVEGEMEEVSEAEMLEAIKIAHEEIKKHCVAQIELTKELGVVRREYCHENNDEDLRKQVKDFCYDKVYSVAKSMLKKHERSEAFAAVKEEFILSLPEEEQESKAKLVARYFHDVEKIAMRNMILDDAVRLDGRKTDQIRPIECEVDFLPSSHGSALFTRGETQSLTSITLGTILDEKILDGVLHRGSEKFVLHYNFPPFSTGDARPYRGVGRREIGHGNLAHRALKRMIPNGEDNPYTIRVVSDILESNGSSSMATVCAGTLALMDAGIKIKKPVSGIAMGLISEPKGARFAILSDILGDEDHLGDMDFKVTGTKDGITATQMDIKVDGLPYEVLAKALDQAREGRLHILGKMTAVIAQPNSDLKPHAPRIEQFTIARDMIGAIIGPGGKIIQEMQRTTGATINIEEANNQGIVTVFADNMESRNAAVKWIKGIASTPEEGEIYVGKVKSIMPFGAFIEITPGKDGLLHISEIDWKRVEKVEDVLKEGDMVEVKLIEVDKKTGKLKLSRKVLLPKPDAQQNK